MVRTDLASARPPAPLRPAWAAAGRPDYGRLKMVRTDLASAQQFVPLRPVWAAAGRRDDGS
jgi:hypothetical protein